MFKYLTKNVFKKFRKVKTIKAATGFELMNNRFLVNDLTGCASCPSNNLGKEQNYKIIFGFILYFDRKYLTIWGCLILPKSKLRTRSYLLIDKTWFDLLKLPFRYVD